MIRLCLLLVAINACGQAPFRHDLKFSRLPSRWDEALPLGNGLVGALVWEKDGKLRISLDRSDLWDLRPTQDLDQLTFSKVRQHLEAGTYEEVQRFGDLPYERDPAPTKIPGAALEFTISSFGESKDARLFIREGLGQVVWTHGAVLTTFVHPELPLGWFRLSGADGTPELIPPRYADAANRQEGNSVQGQGLARLGYPQGQVIRSANEISYVQPGWNGFEYRVAVRWQYVNGAVEGCWSITSNMIKGEPAEKVVNSSFHRGYQTDLSTSKMWWKSFWAQSTISLPDSILERQWYLEQYKFGCVARSNAPPITLQAVWTADNGNLPPWKGDIHNDLNIQLSYWPAYSGNHLKEAEGLVSWLHEQKPQFARWTKQYFGVGGMNAPGVCTLTGEAMGGWIQYSQSPTTAGWLGHHFYLHWRYTKDREFLRDKAYPWISDFATFIENLSVKGENGKRRLPLSSSPEFYDNTPKAWFRETTNYDLSIIRWTYTAAAEMANELGLPGDVEKWNGQLSQWPGLALDETGSLGLAPGHPYPESHRHFSHLLGLHPLGLLNYEDETDKKTMESSIRVLLSKGTQAWVGYSFTWLGNIHARMGKGEEAASALRTFATCFCLSNSFHANGDQCGGKHSSYTYRPFTLEGNFAFAAGVQEMLLQSHGGVLRLFPAVPPDWDDISFEGLRAEGAFVVKAQRAKGKLKEVLIRSEKGGELVIDLKDESMKVIKAKHRMEGSKVYMTTTPGQSIRLTSITP